VDEPNLVGELIAEERYVAANLECVIRHFMQVCADVTGVVMSRYVSAGLSLDKRTWDRLDQLAEEWDDNRAAVVGRSEVARDALPLGLTAIELLDSYARRELSRREREGRLRQAIHDFESDATDSEQVLVDRLAEVADVDALALERALLDLKSE